MANECSLGLPMAAHQLISETFIKAGSKVYHINDGFYYYVHKKINQRISLRCVYNKTTHCPGRMSMPADVTQRTIDNVRHGRRPHNHLHLREWFNKQCARYRCVQRFAQEDTEYRKVFNEETTGLPAGLSFQATTQAMYRAKKKANIPANNPGRKKRERLTLSKCLAPVIVESDLERPNQESVDQLTIQPLMANQQIVLEAQEIAGSKVYHINDGFYYYFHTKRTNRISFRCVYNHKTLCPGRMAMPADETQRTADNVTLGVRPHNHPHLREWFLKQCAKDRCLQRCVKEKTGYRTIYNQETAALPPEIVKDMPFKAFGQTMYRARKMAKLEIRRQQSKQSSADNVNDDSNINNANDRFSETEATITDSVAEDEATMVDSVAEDETSSSDLQEEENSSSPSSHLENTPKQGDRTVEDCLLSRFQMKEKVAETSADETLQTTSNSSEVDFTQEDYLDLQPFTFIDCGAEFTLEF